LGNARQSATPPASHALDDRLPPIAELARRKGDAARGAEIFRRPTVACSHCHQVNGTGAEFGPNLSEIGTKLAKEAIYEAILDPSSGISFGYEAWQIALRNGEQTVGLLASETDDEIAIKVQSGLVTRYRKREVASRQKQPLSIMPNGLAQSLSQPELADLVEYLASLRRDP
jgi:putative heme-binding domain-containing protein